MLIFADKTALITSGIITIVCLIYYILFCRNKEYHMPSIEDEIGIIEEPDKVTREKMDKEYRIWKICTIVITIIAIGIYAIPMIM